MKYEETKQLKEGQTVYVAVKYLGNATDGESAHVKIPTTDWMDMGHHNVVSIGVNVSFEHIVIPAPVKENKPKYDPCRLFKKGDEVEYHPKDGRANPNLLVGRRYKVAVDEPCDSGIVQVEFDGLRHIDTFVAYNNLELVAPVEELEPYRILENLDCFEVRRKKPDDDRGTGYERDVSMFFFSHPPYTRTKEAARAAAEAECKRLNAKYRKEQGNG